MKTVDRTGGRRRTSKRVVLVALALQGLLPARAQESELVAPAATPAAPPVGAVPAPAPASESGRNTAPESAPESTSESANESAPGSAPGSSPVSSPDSAPPVSGEPPPAAPDSPEVLLARRDAAQATYLALIDQKRYDEAVTLAAQVVDLTSRSFGAQSIELAAPLVNLATAQMHAGDLVGAEGNYQACIALIERAEGIASPRLVNPLVGLGETYMRGGMYVQANDSYLRALRVNHAAMGFFNLEQMKVLDGISESYLGIEKLAEANAQQRAQVAIHQRRAERGDDAELVEALYKLGRWYNRTGQYAESREAYQWARRILRERGGADDPAQVDALLGEALGYLNEGAVPASVSTLKRALDLVDSQPVKDPLKRAEVLVALGDLYTVARQHRAARQRYGQAWTDLSGDEILLAQRDEYFREPTIISSPRLPLAVGPDGARIDARSAVPGNFAEGSVLATLTVTPEGDAIDAKIVESDPPGLLDRDVLRTLGVTAFRPRMADGVCVASEAVQFRHQFRYPRSVAAAPGSAEAPASAPLPAGDAGEPIRYPDAQEQPGDPNGGVVPASDPAVPDEPPTGGH
jgi:tetratricopeptide (TPR) repeat protein